MNNKAFQPNISLVVLLIIVVAVLSVSIILFAGLGNGQKITIPCKASYNSLLQTFSYQFGDGTITDDNNVLTSNPLITMPWDTGNLVIRGTIINFVPASWDANVQGGTSEVSVGALNAIFGGETGLGNLELRHLVPGNYDILFELYEVKGFLGMDRTLILSDTYTFSFAEGDEMITKNWTNEWS